MQLKVICCRNLSLLCISWYDVVSVAISTSPPPPPCLHSSGKEAPRNVATWPFPVGPPSTSLALRDSFSFSSLSSTSSTILSSSFNSISYLIICASSFRILLLSYPLLNFLSRFYLYLILDSHVFLITPSSCHTFFFPFLSSFSSTILSFTFISSYFTLGFLLVEV